MMSRLLSEHPAILSISEFFVSLGPSAFPDGSLDGADFWEILSRPHPVANILTDKGATRSDRLPGRDERFAAGEVPGISLSALPGLTDDPDGLYDFLKSEVPTWDHASVGMHYLRLFRTLRDRLGRSVMIERSGSALEILPELISCFPEAQFVHLYRTGPDCALSMSRHPAFRLTVLIDRMRKHLGEDPYHHYSEQHFDKLPDDLRRFLPGSFDADALDRESIPLASFGRLWSERVQTAEPHLVSIPRHNLLHVSYEKLLAAPEGELLRFARFTGMPEPEKWSQAAARKVDAARGGGSLELPERERAELEQACAPGMQALRRLAGSPPAPSR